MSAVQRRRVVRLLASTALFALTGPALRADGARRRRPTPAQMEGPYYPTRLPADIDADLLANGSQRYVEGEASWVEGVLTDLHGRALQGATVEIWQCDHAGHYHHPSDGGRADPAFQGFGRVTVDARGRWRFRTLRPVPYPGRTPHIHAKVWQGGRELLTTQLYVEGDPGNARDVLWRRLSAADRAAITAPYVAGPDGLRARYELAVAT